MTSRTCLISPQEKLKGLYAYITQNTGMADPLALSTNPKEKGIKVARSVAVDLNLPNLSKEYGFKLSAGNGSRGGGGVNSKGFAFEGQIINDLVQYKEAPLDGDFKFPNMIKKMHDIICSRMHHSSKSNLTVLQKL